MTMLRTICFALVGSSCCAIQLVLNAFSIGCAGFAILDQFAPLFASLTMASIVSSLWRKRTATNILSALISIALLATPRIVKHWNVGGFGSNAIQSKASTHCAATLSWSVRGLKCEGCAARLKRRLQALDQVDSVEVDFATKNIRMRVPLDNDGKGIDPNTVLKRWNNLVAEAVASLDFSYSLANPFAETTCI